MGFKLLIMLMPTYHTYENIIISQITRIRIYITRISHNIKYVVDKLHIQGHEQQERKDECGPNLFPELKTVNILISKQINYWLGKYKFIMKHINVFRFKFYFKRIKNILTTNSFIYFLKKP